jgi:hypothetical protein
MNSTEIEAELAMMNLNASIQEPATVTINLRLAHQIVKTKGQNAHDVAIAMVGLTHLILDVCCIFVLDWRGEVGYEDQVSYEGDLRVDFEMGQFDTPPRRRESGSIAFDALLHPSFLAVLEAVDEFSNALTNQPDVACVPITEGSTLSNFQQSFQRQIERWRNHTPEWRIYCRENIYQPLDESALGYLCGFLASLNTPMTIEHLSELSNWPMASLLDQQNILQAIHAWGTARGLTRTAEEHEACIIEEMGMF